MATSKSKSKGLHDLLEHGLKDIYYAEKQIYKSLPKMIKAAEDEDLKQGLSDHREETADQITKLEEIFKLMELPLKGEKCDAIDGILEEGDGILEDFGETPAGDAAIIFSCQAVEHYEITRYGSMHAFATALGLDEVADLLAEILEQEKTADEKLSTLADSRVNYAAKAGDDEPSSMGSVKGKTANRRSPSSATR